MGEIADMMLDGTLCEGCGEYIDDDGAEGFPRYCSPQCAAGRGAQFICDTPKPSPNARRAERQNAERQKAAGRNLPCPTCGKRFRYASAVAQHVRDKHASDHREVAEAKAGSGK